MPLASPPKIGCGSDALIAGSKRVPVIMLDSFGPPVHTLTAFSTAVDAQPTTLVDVTV